MHTNREFNTNNIVKLISVYDYNRVKRYLNDLYRCNIIAQARPNKTIKYYTLTDLGLSLVAEISNNAEKIMYDFCNKYNISL
jgi:predicted transcriptional regulator